MLSTLPANIGARVSFTKRRFKFLFSSAKTDIYIWQLAWYIFPDNVLNTYRSCTAVLYNLEKNKDYTKA